MYIIVLNLSTMAIGTRSELLALNVKCLEDTVRELLCTI